MTVKWPIARSRRVDAGQSVHRFPAGPIRQSRSCQLRRQNANPMQACRSGPGWVETGFQVGLSPSPSPGPGRGSGERLEAIEKEGDRPREMRQSAAASGEAGAGDWRSVLVCCEVWCDQFCRVVWWCGLMCCGLCGMVQCVMWCGVVWCGVEKQEQDEQADCLDDGERQAINQRLSGQPKCQNVQTALTARLYTNPSRQTHLRPLSGCRHQLSSSSVATARSAIETNIEIAIAIDWNYDYNCDHDCYGDCGIAKLRNCKIGIGIESLAGDVYNPVHIRLRSDRHFDLPICSLMGLQV
ncbi:unnamed protein product [Protopolystoma xenopodis]|uniref:Uncharacterized protein n=1 Tax=Protopolystoma xenopodis TaxID=117903 RepID=A0A3S5B2T2_9PLAT|nr:unnamed protein product [Protopolystoma xenopodis]